MPQRPTRGGTASPLRTAPGDGGAASHVPSMATKSQRPGWLASVHFGQLRTAFLIHTLLVVLRSIGFVVAAPRIVLVSLLFSHGMGSE